MTILPLLLGVVALLLLIAICRIARAQRDLNELRRRLDGTRPPPAAARPDVIRLPGPRRHG